jgi:hypothetical protein
MIRGAIYKGNAVYGSNDWGSNPKGVLDFIKKHASEQAGRAVPRGWVERRADEDACYEVSGHWAAREPDAVTYTEGIAFRSGVPIAHAWLTDTDGQVIDLATPGSRYLGVQIPLRVLVDHGLLETWPRLPPLIAAGWKPK